MSDNQTQNLRLTLPEGILSYPHLFEPSAVKNDPTASKRYTCQVLVPLTADLTTLNQMVKAAADAAFPQFAKNGYPANFRWPVQKGSAMMPGDEFYADKMVISCARQEKQGRPALVFNDPQRTEIVQQNELYAGCKVIVHCSVYGYQVGTPGVALGLNGVLKVADGERLDNQPTASEMFATVAPGEAAHAPNSAPGGSAGASPGAPMPWETGGGGQTEAPQQQAAAPADSGKMPWD